MGIALLWKPIGLGSQECLARFKREALQFKSSRGKSKIGHTGTLDPFAEGVLLVAWQEGTKLLAPLQGLPKSYVADMKFGATTVTLDPTSPERLPEAAAFASLNANFRERAPEFLAGKIGTFEQVPPAFSAVHVDGQRAYDLARAGKEVVLKARSVTLNDAEHLHFEPAEQRWSFRVDVSAGTYIRCLARDWGQELTGYPGYLLHLCRDRVGPFSMHRPAPTGDPQNAPAEGELVWKALEPSDFGSLFGILTVDDQEGDELVRFGRYPARSLPRGDAAKGYLVQNAGGKTLAWLEPNGQKIGRIFNSDPFEQSIDSF